MIADWNMEKDEFEWHKMAVIPHNKHLKLLKTKPANEIYKMWFPDNSPYLNRPEGVSDMDWDNHVNSLIGMITEIKQYILESDRTYTDMMRE